MTDSRFITLPDGRRVSRLRCHYCGALDAEYQGDLDAYGRDIAACTDGFACAERRDDDSDEAPRG